MEITQEGLERLIEAVVAEAKKAKKGQKKESVDAVPHGFSFAPAYDFSHPLGGDNLYHLQGQAAWGPQTLTGLSMNIDDNIVTNKDVFRFKESLIRSMERGELDEGLAPRESVWWVFEERHAQPPKSMWETGLRWYDFQERGLGESLLDEKHIGFSKLKGQLARKGAKSPGGLAATIGREKYGAKSMAKKSAAGRK